MRELLDFNLFFSLNPLLRRDQAIPSDLQERSLEIVIKVMFLALKADCLVQNQLLT